MEIKDPPPVTIQTLPETNGKADPWLLRAALVMLGCVGALCIVGGLLSEWQTDRPLPVVWSIAVQCVWAIIYILQSKTH